MANWSELPRKLPAPVLRRLQRGRKLIVEARMSMEDARLRLATPPAVRRLPPLAEPALNAVFARNEHGVYCVPAQSRGVVSRNIRRGRVWERDTLRLIGTIAGDVVHAGAFFGDFLPALARSRAETVWAFEPNLENFRCANVTVYLNGLANVTLIHAGLSAAAGEAFVTNSSAKWAPSGGASRLVFGDSYGRSREAVPLTTVDETVPVERHVGVVHLDVEGHEQNALTGALGTIARCNPVLIVETMPDGEWLARHLPDYHVGERVDRNTVLRPH